MKALNELCCLGLDNEKLAEYASKLGSDCAFFIWNRPMIGTGRGEILEPFDLDLSGYEIKVLVPEGISVSTAEAYRGIVPRDMIDGGTTAPTTVSLRSTPPLAPLSVPRVAAVAGAVGPPSNLREVLRRPVEEWKGVLVNDFEATVFKAHPELEAIKQSLYESGAAYAAMSGSGSAMFGIYKK